MSQAKSIAQLEEKKQIQRAYRRLLHAIKKDVLPADKKLIRRSYEMAVRAHAKQRRKSGEPFILHPIEVATICAREIGLGPTSIMAALLHDVVEDSDVELDEIRKQFGDQIADIVEGLTKFKDIYDSASPQAENFRKILMTLTKDVRVVLIKMADRLHNMRTIGSMPQHKQLKIASETSFIYAPLAHRFGLYSIKTEMQDLCMKVTDKDRYLEIATKLNATKKERTRYINSFVDPIRPALENMGVSYRVSGRPKSIFSVANKIKKKGVPFEEIYDLFAIRIIIDVKPELEKETCWKIYSIVTDQYTPIPERLKDFITTPKANGYESLHTTVVGQKGRFVEIQIRSERMDMVAEKGFAAHWRYKGVQSTGIFETWLNSVREALENPSTDAIEFLNDFKSNLFADEIMVFTPKGDHKILPKGATALDFAFSVHSEIGYQCVAIKVNQKLVPLNHTLRNGDQISVTTSKNQKPTESWLKMVVTGKARSRIRSALKDQKRAEASFGKETLQRKLKNLKVDFELNADLLVEHFGFKNRMDFYYAITKEKVNLSEIKSFKIEGKQLVKVEKEAKVAKPKPKPLVQTARSDKVQPKLLINGEAAKKYSYSLATCCNPVQGDDVFGFLTSNKGMRIHRTTCSNATHLLANYGYKVLNVEWQDDSDSSFVATLLITGIDDIGVLQSLTDVITNKLQVNIRSLSISGEAGVYEGRISLVIHNTDQLQFTIRTLTEVEGVDTVTRVD